jgi:hypothetical protein
MPRSTDLPDDLKALVRRNTLRVSDTGFEDDCRRLVLAIEQILEKNAAEQLEREQKVRLEAEKLQEAEQWEKQRLEAEARRCKEEERLNAEQRHRDSAAAELQQRLAARRQVREERERLEAEQLAKELDSTRQNDQMIGERGLKGRFGVDTIIGLSFPAAVCALISYTTGIFVATFSRTSNSIFEYNYGNSSEFMLSFMPFVPIGVGILFHLMPRLKIGELILAWITALCFVIVTFCPSEMFWRAGQPSPWVSLALAFQLFSAITATSSLLRKRH